MLSLLCSECGATAHYIEGGRGLCIAHAREAGLPRNPRATVPFDPPLVTTSAAGGVSYTFTTTNATNTTTGRRKTEESA